MCKSMEMGKVLITKVGRVSIYVLDTVSDRIFAQRAG